VLHAGNGEPGASSRQQLKDSGGNMVYFEDTGSVIEAPIEFVWEYLVSEQHGPVHSKSARKFELKETVGPTSLVSAERYLNGKWSTFVSKSTDFAPFCICNEEVEGDFAGSKFVLLYRPKGNRTQVDVYGDVQSKVFTPDEAKKTYLKLLENAYEEDVSVISKLHKKRSH
jgi:hypothetical protein